MAQIETLQRNLAHPLPRGLAEFLRSWNGAELFHESIRLYGIDESFGSLLHANQADRPAGLEPGDFVFGDTAAGDLLVLNSQAAVIRLRGFEQDEESSTWEERWHAGSSLEAFLASTVTRELPLYDSEGEFVLEAFEEDGLALTPSFALKLMRKALKKDPGSAELHHELGVAERRLERWKAAAAAFAEATTLDPSNPWIWFDLGRAQLQQDMFASAAEAFGRAKEVSRGHQSARYAAWQAFAFKQAGDEPRRLLACEEARQQHPDIEGELQRAAAEAVTADDTDAYDAISPLLDAFTAASSARRLPLAVSPPPVASATATQENQPANERPTPRPRKRPQNPAPAPKRPRGKPPAAKSASTKLKAKPGAPRSSRPAPARKPAR